MLNIQFVKLIEPTTEISETLSRWENDPTLIPLSRPNKNLNDLNETRAVTVDILKNRLKNHKIYLIYLTGQLIGEMDYRIDPDYLFKKETGTAWIGILIGEENGRGKGIGTHAMQFLEEEIKAQKFRRIELGVFEFNTRAIGLYQKSGFKEITRIKDFTFFNGKLWQDIRMEKYIQD